MSTSSDEEVKPPSYISTVVARKNTAPMAKISVSQQPDEYASIVLQKDTFLNAYFEFTMQIFSYKHDISNKRVLYKKQQFKTSNILWIFTLLLQQFKEGFPNIESFTSLVVYFSNVFNFFVFAGLMITASAVGITNGKDWRTKIISFFIYMFLVVSLGLVHYWAIKVLFKFVDSFLF